MNKSKGNTKNSVGMAGEIMDITFETMKNGNHVARVVIQTDGPSWMKDPKPEQCQVTAFGRSCEDARNFAIGQRVAFNGRVQGREHQGKWYCNVIVDHFMATGGKPAEKPHGDDDLGW